MLLWKSNFQKFHFVTFSEKVRMSKIIFVLGSYQSLKNLEGKRAYYFRFQSCKITVCLRSNLLYRCDSIYIYIQKMCKKTLAIYMNQSFWFHGYWLSSVRLWNFLIIGPTKEDILPKINISPVHLNLNLESLHLILSLYFFSKLQKKLQVVVWLCPWKILRFAKNIQKKFRNCLILYFNFSLQKYFCQKVKVQI